ncbi:MAG: hypothetical protein FGM57_03660 [Candidatus Taylorbacteria bacterium]|nr:hypothetical protein [Candidatus Taylorbacteria bacterium]
MKALIRVTKTIAAIFALYLLFVATPAFAQVVINAPTDNTTYGPWNPSVSWGGYSTTCEYNLSGNGYLPLDCAQNGADIPPPGYNGTWSLDVRGFDIDNNMSEAHVYNLDIQMYGCTDSNAINYSSYAVIDDSSCYYLQITNPTFEENVSVWSPAVNWGVYSPTTCEYSYDNSSFTGVDCNSGGSDIPAPSPGSVTLYVTSSSLSMGPYSTNLQFSYNPAQGIVITAPVASSTIYPSTWLPSIDWGDYNSSCEYSYDNSNWNYTNCVNNGSDISAPPSYGTTVLYVRGYDGSSNQGETSVEFQYDSEDVPGCTNSEAINYNSEATVDDGSCYYIEITTPTEGGSYDNWSPAVNWGASPQSCEYRFDSDGYNSVSCSSGGSDIPAPTEGSRNLSVRAYYPNLIATHEDSVNFTYSIPVSGCTNSYAINYNSNANTDDGSCYYIEITSPTSNESINSWSPVVNFGVSASSCQYNFDNGGWTTVTCGNNGSDISTPSGGSRTLNIQSVNPSQGTVNTSVSFTYLEPVSITSPTASETVTSWSPVVSWGTYGYTCQYSYDNSTWNNLTCSNNGSDIPEPGAGSQTLYVRATTESNLTSEANVTFTYEPPVYGCTDSYAINYDSGANTDDGSCYYIEITSPSSGETITSWSPVVNFGMGATSCGYSFDNSSWTTVTCGNNGSDISDPGYGSRTMYVRANNPSQGMVSASAPFTYNEPPVYGCTDSYAINYNSGANTDDGSCYYILISSPTSNETVTSWSPNVNFGVGVSSCEYNFNGSAWTNVTCGNNGSDIPTPSSSGSVTMDVRANNPGQGIVSTSVSFSYMQSVSITSPTSNETVTSWSPVVSWGSYGNDGNCQYSYNNSDWNNLTCSNNGSDIPTPSTGSQTLYVRGVTASNLTSSASVSFTYTPDVYGCTNSYAINYNSGANTDDGSCYYIAINSPSSGETITSWSPSVNWGVYSPTTCEYSFNGSVYETVNCANNGSDISTPSAGGNTLYVRASASGIGPHSTSTSFTYVSPVSINSPADSTIVHEWNPVVSWGSYTSTCQVSLDGGNTYTNVTCSSESIGSEIPAPAPGTVNLSVRGYLNDSTSVANVTFTYIPYSSTPSQPDLISEDDTGSSDADDVTSQGANLTITGSGISGATITVCRGGCTNEVLGETTVNGPGDTWTYELPTLSEGVHSITATALESGKATSTESTALVLTIDQTGPSQTSTPQMESDDDTGLSNSDGYTTNNTPRFTVSCEVNSTVSLLVDNTENTSTTCSSGSVTIPVVGTLSENSYSITTVQTDVAGNPSAVSNTKTITIDQTAPVISSVASSTTDTTATISWSTDENATSSVRYGITTSYGLASSTNVVAQNRSVSLSNLAPSTTYHFELASTDLAGNRTVTSDYTFTTRATPDTTPPTITSSVINGTTTVLTLSEILSSTSTPNISTFTLGGTSAQVTAVDISGSTVTLTLNQAVLSTETITLSYVAPVSGKIQDPSGNPLAGFSNRTLTNQTPAVAEASTSSQSSSAPTAYATSGGISFTAPTNILVIGTRASGQVGPAVYVAGVLNSTTGAPLNNGYGGLTNTYKFDSNVPAGRRDEDIKNLQRFLNAQGFRVNPIDGAPGSPGYETDLFGTLTRQALARFQAVVGITPVGFFGPKTRAFINNFLEKNAPAK